MKEKASHVMWFFKMSPARAEELLRQHHEAFREAGCRKCPGSCCKDCAESLGYIIRDYPGPMIGRHEHFEKLRAKYGFDEVKGFSGENGCRIPVQERSPTCVSFWCGLRLNAFMEDADVPGNQLPPKKQARVEAAVNKLHKNMLPYFARDSLASRRARSKQP